MRPTLTLITSIGIICFLSCSSSSHQQEASAFTLCQEFYDDGRLKSEVECKGGVFNGLYKEYHKNGDLWKEVHYQDNVVVDTTRYYYSRTGELLKEVPMKAGAREGISTEYYKNGQAKILTTFRANQLDGPKIWFTETGDTTQYISYQKGIPHGWVRAYRPDGSLILVAQAEAGLLLSDMVYYPEAGRELKPNHFSVGDQASHLPLSIPIKRENLYITFSTNAYGKGLEVSIEE